MSCAMTERCPSVQSYGPGGPGMDVCLLFLVFRLIVYTVFMYLDPVEHGQRKR